MDNYADDPDPTMILECQMCLTHIPFLGDGDEQVVDGTFTLPEFYLVTCPICGAIYEEGATLEVIDA